MIPSPHPADGAGAAIVAPRSPTRSRPREEIEAGAGGGAGQGEAKIGVDEGDGEAGEDALVDAGLAGAEQAAQLMGAVTHHVAGAICHLVRFLARFFGRSFALQCGRFTRQNSPSLS